MVTLTRTHCSGEVPLGCAHSEARQAEDRNTLRDISHEQEYYFGTETDVLAMAGNAALFTRNLSFTPSTGGFRQNSQATDVLIKVIRIVNL